MPEEKSEERTSRLNQIVVGLITALLVTAPGVTLGHMVTIALLEERVETVRVEVAKQDDRLKNVEEAVIEVRTNQANLAKNVRIAANEALSNGEKIDTLARDLNRLIGAYEFKAGEKER